ncbi:MAG TPA: S9 family peptidase [Thermomicrobiales bacterium]|nr:S9 family peptidase [Thermomicrobiales bacterium]
MTTETSASTTTTTTPPQKRPLTAEDLFAIELVGDPQASPDGRHLAWVVTTLDKEKDAYRSAIWVSNADGSEQRKLTSGSARDTSPRWSQDSTTIAFVSNRQAARPVEKRDEPKDDAGKDVKATGKKDGPSAEPKPLNQIWAIRIDGGEATQITNHPNGASSPAWSPDGERIAFVASDDVTKDDDFLPPTTNGQVADERIVHDLRYRFDARGWLEKYAHIWTVEVASGEQTQMTFGDVNDSSPAWSPDGATIAFVGNRRPDRKRLGASTILTVPATGGEVNVLAPDDASFDTPVWSPDGDRIAFLGHLDAKTGGARNDTVWTVRADGSDVTNHTEATDITFQDVGMSDVVGDGGNSLVWLDESHVLALAASHGETQVQAVDLSSNAVTAVTSGKRRISGFTRAGDRLVFTSGEIHVPFELHAADLDGANEAAITSFNAKVVEEIELPAAIDLVATAPDGTEIQGWLIPPVGFDETSQAKHPLIVQIHGGPHAMYAYAMFHEMQLMASKGYAVLFCNPRGSSGYGEEFTGTTRGRWGESDMPDVIAVLEKALERPWIDPERLGVTGGSYGGYLTNWIVSHDDRFKAAVTQRCVSNFYSFFGTSDIGFDFGVFEADGLPWSDAEKLLKYSPISYVDKITTPLLIIHSEQDLRCPIEQAEQMYASLKYLEREVGFVRIPGESHGLSRNGTPSRRLARLHHLIGWFDRYI